MNRYNVFMRFPFSRRRPNVLIGTPIGAIVGACVAPGGGNGLLHDLRSSPYIFAFLGSMVGAIAAIVIEVAKEDSRR